MVKHAQTIRRQKPTNCLSLFDHFVGLALKGLNASITLIYIDCKTDCSHWTSLDHKRFSSNIMILKNQRLNQIFAMSNKKCLF